MHTGEQSSWTFEKSQDFNKTSILWAGRFQSYLFSNLTQHLLISTKIHVHKVGKTAIIVTSSYWVKP